jgi:glyoxylase-like metal-dependent hydrolase (beta-lactamase superfamily II)
MNPFTVTQPLPDVFHIQDSAQVCFTLIRGERDTLLWDTGVGLYDVAECVAPYIRGKLYVVLSHAHYDHAYGQHYFAESFVHPIDLKRCKRCVDRRYRTEMLKRFEARGWIDEAYPKEQFLSGTPETVQALPFEALNLGNLEVNFLRSPGHTSGSIVAYIPKMRLLLTGDSWNPQTWIFFPESRPLTVYVNTMRKLAKLDAEHVLCPHALPPRTMQQLRAYVNGLNVQTFAAAQSCTIPPYTQINTWCCYPEPESKLGFNTDRRS